MLRELHQPLHRGGGGTQPSSDWRAPFQLAHLYLQLCAQPLMRRQRRRTFALLRWPLGPKNKAGTRAGQKR